MKLLMAVVAMSVWASLGTGSAGAVDLTCGATLASPGVYTLSADLQCASSGPLIGSPNVTINLNGYSISGPGPATTTVGFEVQVSGHQSAVIENGTVRDFGTGVHLDFGGAQISDLHVTRNGAGIVESIAPAGPLDLGQSDISDNVGDGIHSAIADGPITITDSRVSHNGGYGLWSHETLIQARDSAFSNNGRAGFWEDEFGVDLEGVRAINNGGDGIFIGLNDFPDLYTLLNNTANANGGHGIDFEGNANPIVIFPPPHLAGNNAHGNKTPPQCINLPC